MTGYSARARGIGLARQQPPHNVAWPGLLSLTSSVNEKFEKFFAARRRGRRKAPAPPPPASARAPPLSDAAELPAGRIANLF
jgi:hypothetical protein